MYGSMSGGGMGFGVLGMILVWLIPLALIFLVGRSLFGRDRGGDEKSTPPARSALDTLKESYARGEIEREEYLRKRDDLLDR